MRYRYGNRPNFGGIRVRQYLAERGVSLELAHQLYSPFGRAAKRRYIAKYGYEPRTARGRYNGGPSSGCLYPEHFRPVLDEIFNKLTKSIRDSSDGNTKKPRRSV